jgi:hypothetical protein
VRGREWKIGKEWLLGIIIVSFRKIFYELGGIRVRGIELFRKLGYLTTLDV